MILAFELSTRAGSIALCDADRTVATRAWNDPTARHGELWPALASLKDETALDWSALKAIAVGRGPGSFSGLRAAITAARVLATPDNAPVVAISSGSAMAHGWFRDNPEATCQVVVAGDARRGAIWFAVFEKIGEQIQQAHDWSLAPAREFPPRAPTNAVIITSDIHRLCAALGEGAKQIIPEPADCFPTASDIAFLARQRMERGLPGEPVEPLYLHPATTA